MLPAWCGYGVRVTFSFVDGLLDALPGVVIMTMHSTIAAGFYATARPAWAPSLHWDQRIGGGLMFTLAEAGAVPFLLVLMIHWVREDERTAREIDLHLDREAAQNAPATNPVGQPMRPWWETDPDRLAQRTWLRDPPDTGTGR
jgi:putative copper resistance protein D